MNEKFNDMSWRMKRSGFLLLLLIPVFYFMPFFYMGKRTNQDKYTKMGIFHAVSALVTFAVMCMSLVYFPLLLAGILHVVAWLLCIVQTLQCRDKYLQALEWKQEEQTPNQLLADKKWRRRNSLGCWWAAIPLFGGLGTAFVGRRTGNRLLQAAGIVSVVAVLAAYLYAGTMLTNGWEIHKLPMAIGIFVLYTILCIHPLLVGMYYDDYLAATAQIWEEDIAQFPVMDDVRWRAKGSLWQILTCIPSMGSFGLFWVAFQCQSGKTLLGAILLCAFELGSIMLPSVLMENQALMSAHPFVQGLAAVIGTLWFVAYVLNIFYGTLIRWDMLRLRAWLAEQED